MKFILLSFFLALRTTAFASSCPPDLDKKKPIDQVITKLAGMDGDGLEDKLELHLKGKDFHLPITWGLKIYSKGKVIYQRSGSNDRIEPFSRSKATSQTAQAMMIASANGFFTITLTR